MGKQALVFIQFFFVYNSIDVMACAELILQTCQVQALLFLIV